MYLKSKGDFSNNTIQKHFQFSNTCACYLHNVQLRKHSI